MASVARIRQRAVEQRDPSVSTARETSMVTWLGGRYGASAESTGQATTHSAVYSCISKIVGLFTAMGVSTWTTAGPRDRRIPDPPIVANPSPDASLDQPHWLAQVMTSWLLRGDVYGTIVDESSAGWPTKIDIVDPDSVALRTRAGKTTWWVGGKEQRLWTEGGPLWHVPSWMIMPGSSEGLDPIVKAAMDVGLGLAARNYGAEWFRSGGNPVAVIENEKEISNDVADRAQQRWVEGIERGGRAPRVLGSGWKYQALQVSPDQSRMLELMQANVADVCRYFGVPPEEIGGSSGDSMTYANVEGRGLQLLRNLAPWFGLVQRMWSGLLPRPQEVRLDPAVFLRMTPKTEAELWTERIRSGVYTPNEARETAGLAPSTDQGKELLWPPFAVHLGPDPADPNVDPNADPAADPKANGQKADPKAVPAKAK